MQSLSSRKGTEASEERSRACQALATFGHLYSTVLGAGGSTVQDVAQDTATGSPCLDRVVPSLAKSSGRPDVCHPADGSWASGREGNQEQQGLQGGYQDKLNQEQLLCAHVRLCVHVCG